VYQRPSTGGFLVSTLDFFDAGEGNRKGKEPEENECTIFTSVSGMIARSSRR